jgi:phenylalanyl-tRNA synthetase beta chain
MKISYNWLKDYIQLAEEPSRLAERLSLAGLEVEEVLEKKLDFPDVVVGRVVNVEKHPNADKLKVCQVDIGDLQLKIVCGAPNVSKGQIVPAATVGASLPNGLKIHKAKIRGVLSEGMVCSKAELGLEEKSDGIWVLPENLSLGKPVGQALKLETDYILDIGVTPNRPDCLSHLGIAREVAALTNQKVKKPPVQLKETNAKDEIEIIIDSPEGCPRYSARIIKNVTIGESPAWLSRRLEAVGMRPVNNIVDITNYVLLETGHPLHAFDYDLIAGKKIIVREAKSGETFTTLDNKERKLETGTVLICDADKPVAIGGIMGGVNSEVSHNTKNILLESAYFNPESIQISSRHLALSTEASQRFERGADPEGNIYALDKAAQLIAQLTGGKISGGITDSYPKKHKPHFIKLKCERINRLLGTDLSKAAITKLLESIELSVKNDEVKIPSFRPDLHETADLAEEVARLYGLENIIPKQNFQISYDIKNNDFDLFIDQLKTDLCGMGLQEVITSSMVNREFWDKTSPEKLYPLFNPISKDLDGLRNSLIPSLVQVVQFNRNRKTGDLKIFEINRIFNAPDKLDQQPCEEVHLGIALSGNRDGSLWNSSHKLVDFFDIKGFVEAICDKISLDNWNFISYSDSYIQGGGAALQIGQKNIGILGRLHEHLQKLFELDEDIYVAELNVSQLYNHRKIIRKYQPIPKYPGVERDLALIIDEDIEAENIEKEIKERAGKLLMQLEIFDIFRGKQIPEGKKSLAFRLGFQSTERTLTEEEINTLVNKIYKGIQESFHAKLRE